MPRPKDIYTLVDHPSLATLTPPPIANFLGKSDFPNFAWQDAYRDEKLCSVAGFGEYHRIAVGSRADLQQHWDAAKKMLRDGNPDWAKNFPNNYKLDSPNHWTNYGFNQCKLVMKGRPASFAAACISILTLDLAVAASGNPKSVDIYGGYGKYPALQIRPLVYSIAELNRSVWGSLPDTARADLYRVTGQSVARRAGRTSSRDASKGHEGPLCALHEIALDRTVSKRLVRDTISELARTRPVAYTVVLDTNNEYPTASLETINFP